MNILVTGSAGFIGFHVSKRLINNGHNVIGVDNINNYYDTNLKKDRIKELNKFKLFHFLKVDITNFIKLKSIFKKNKIDVVINLAAEVGVRNSIESPEKHISANVVGFGNILELSKIYKINRVIYASSSSVYGANKKIPYSIKDTTDAPVSIYAATKKTNELMAHTYSYLYGLKTIGLRFFTVYGPWGRPDMAVFKFTNALFNKEEIQLYNKGLNFRDYTYIDDIVDGIIRSIRKGGFNKKLPFKIFNLGNSKAVSTINLLKMIEKETRIKGKIKLSKKAPGDVLKTMANIDYELKDLGYKPKTKLAHGIKKFIVWYKNFYSIK